MGLSAVVLTRNSAATLKTTLASLAFADEIIVVDDHSEDGTVPIARESGATVYERSLADDFAKQRNYGLSKARHEWVLFVDSDEAVSDVLAKEIQAAVKRIDVAGFYLKRRDVLWGRTLRFGETESVRLMRLGKVGKGMWVRPVHEVWNISGVVGTLVNPLDHYPHPDVAQFLRDIDRYSTINAMHFRSQGVRSSWFSIGAYPVAKFLQNYLFRLGFLDGMPGMVVAVMMSFHSYLTRAKLWHMQQHR